jgi:hypothetical protein
VASDNLSENSADLLDLIDELIQRGMAHRIRELRVGNASVQLQTETSASVTAAVRTQPHEPAMDPETERERVLFAAGG